MGTDGEVVATEGEGEVGKRVALVTLNSVLSSEGLLGTELLVPIDRLIVCQ